MKNNKYGDSFLAIGSMFNVLAFLISLFGVWLLPFAFVFFAVGSILIVFCNLKALHKALIIFGTILAIALPTLYYVQQVNNCFK